MRTASRSYGVRILPVLDGFAVDELPIPFGLGESVFEEAPMAKPRDSESANLSPEAHFQLYDVYNAD